MRWAAAITLTILGRAPATALFVIMLLASLLPQAPAQAAGEQTNARFLRLVLGGTAAAGWNVGNIAPGQSGTRTATLRNTGAGDGKVTIWLSNIVNGEGANPEPETSNLAEPGELGAYVLLKLSGPGLVTNITFPAKVDSFPQRIDDPKYLRIPLLRSGQSIELAWDWELPASTGNDVQGDTLSFTVNYTLEQITPPDPPEPPSPPPQPPEPPSVPVPLPTQPIDIDVDTNVKPAQITSENTVVGKYEVADRQGQFVLGMDDRTTIFAADGGRVRRIVVRQALETLPTPAGTVLVSMTYKITVVTDRSEETEVTFDKPVGVAISYDEDKLPENIARVFVGSYDPVRGFQQLPPPSQSVGESVFGGAMRTVATGETTHFTLFGAVAELRSAPAIPMPPPPARFVTSNLWVSRNEAQPGEDFSVSVSIVNEGGTAGGHLLRLEVDGKVIESRTLILSPNATQTVTFHIADLSLGTHVISVGDLREEVTIKWRQADFEQDWVLLAILIIIALCFVFGNMARSGRRIPR